MYQFVLADSYRVSGFSMMKRVLMLR